MTLPPETQKVAELRAALARAEADERLVSQARNERMLSEYRALPKLYTVKPRNYQAGWSFDTVTPGYYVTRGVEAEALKAFIEKWDNLPSEHDRSNGTGMFYYRTEENILTCAGGGTHVLQTPMLCNDEEWAAIGRGEIPDKYLRRMRNA